MMKRLTPRRADLNGISIHIIVASAL